MPSEGKEGQSKERSRFESRRDDPSTQRQPPSSSDDRGDADRERGGAFFAADAAAAAGDRGPHSPLARDVEVDDLALVVDHGGLKVLRRRGKNEEEPEEEKRAVKSGEGSRFVFFP